MAQLWVRAGHATGGGCAMVAGMPELPEVETTRRGLAPHLVGQRVRAVVVREPRLRWPVAPELIRLLPGQRIEAVERRAKYLLVHTAAGSALLHLGMSGSLRIVPEHTPPGPHDHVDWRLDGRHLLRLTDPRRFWNDGCPGSRLGSLAGRSRRAARRDRVEHHRCGCRRRPGAA